MDVTFEPDRVRATATVGQTLLEVARAAGVHVDAVCNGRGTCAKCKVVAHEGLGPLTEAESHRLTDAEIANGYRLACQAIVLDDVRVVVPDVSHLSILSSGVDQEMSLDPWVRRIVVQVPPATLEDQLSDLDNLQRALRKHGEPERVLTLGALRALPEALRAAGGQVVAVAVDDTIVRVAPSSRVPQVLGLAYDVGTTTVVGYLMDLETGRQLAISSSLNPQTRFGADVVSRIGLCGDSPKGLEQLRQAVVGALNEIALRTCHEAGAQPEDVYGVTVVGNTTMQHLFLGIDPQALAQAPYVPAVTAALHLSAREVGLQVHPDAGVRLLPNVAGWVGADTVGVILSTSLHQHETPALAIDIGTNGEMALGSREKLVTCSTAAGPAFEGAQLSCGMRAAEGAIDALQIDHTVNYHVIGEVSARGVCGSGLVDLIAEMLRVGIVDQTGMMVDADVLSANGHAYLADRITQLGRQRAFEIVGAADGHDGQPVRVTQRDVRELQLAKGAIRAGIEILVGELGISKEDVTHVYLAGAFGNYIRPESALAIGLLPQFPNAKLVPVGNAAGSGAKMALLSRQALGEAVAMLDHVRYLELSGRADFQEQFTEAMVF